MSSDSSQYYQTAKGSLAMRLNNAEQLAEAKKQEAVGLDQQIMAYNDDMEHAKENRDTAIFGLSLGGSGAYKLAYGAGRAVGKKFLMRGTARLQNAVNQYRKLIKPTSEDIPPPDPAELPAEPDVANFQIQTPQVSVTEEGVGGTLKDAYGQDFDPKTLDMSDPENPRPFPPDETPQEFPQTQAVARDGYGNRFDPESVDTSSYNNPQAVRQEDVMGAEDLPERPVAPPREGIEADQPIVSEAPAPTEVRPAGSFEVQTIPKENQTLKPMADDIRTQAGAETSELSDVDQARLQNIMKSDPILSEDNVGTLKSLGADFGDLSPGEIDTGARMILGDGAVETMSNILGVAGSALGAAMPILGLAGDIAGIYFAAKGLSDSKDAVQKEMDDRAKVVQQLANTNIPLNVPKVGASPVMDTAALRQGGLENF